MDPEMERAKARYQSIEPPEELAFAVASAVREGDRRRGRGRALRRALGTGLAACACFVLLLNTSPSFARAMADVPVLGQLARVFTIRAYQVEDPDHLIDVRLPAIENTGHTDLEQRINTEIQTRIQAVLDEAEARARAAREAYVATGGEAEDFMPIIIDVDYEIKCQSDEYLSFVVTATETQASSFINFYTYNIDLTTGRELSLQDVLGPDYKAITDQAVQAGIEARSKDPRNSYFDGTDGVEGFTGIGPDQKFYLNEAGDPVVMFEKYAIAPGYMGVQEFVVAR